MYWQFVEVSETCDCLFFSASAKVALLIANSKYTNKLSYLQTPTADVLLLADKLEKLQFHVITLINLTRSEMENSIEWFFENLPPKAYGKYTFIISLDNLKFHNRYVIT